LRGIFTDLAISLLIAGAGAFLASRLIAILEGYRLARGGAAPTHPLVAADLGVIDLAHRGYSQENAQIGTPSVNKELPLRLIFFGYGASLVSRGEIAGPRWDRAGRGRQARKKAMPRNGAGASRAFALRGPLVAHRPEFLK
jgi:hypothetical protein